MARSSTIPPASSVTHGQEDGRDHNIELVLSVLLSVALAQGLSFFLNIVSDAVWLTLSLMFMFFTIFLIYWLMGRSLTHLVELIRSVSIGLFALSPFVLQRLLAKQEPRTWTYMHVIGYLVVLAVSIVAWGLSERERYHTRWNALTLFGLFLLGGLIIYICVAFSGGIK